MEGRSPQANSGRVGDTAAGSPASTLAATSTWGAQESAVNDTPKQGSRKRRRTSSNIGGRVAIEVNGEALASPASETTVASVNPRKASKISRACDNCKRRKAKCTGTLPCPKCVGKGIKCVYEANYSRGRPRTPPPSVDQVDATLQVVEHLEPTTPARDPEPPSELRAPTAQLFDSNGSVSRASPALGVTEIEGQVFDPTSGMTFLHRAWKRLSKNGHSAEIPNRVTHLSVEQQHIMLAGDRPLPKTTDDNIDRLALPSHEDLEELIALYFDVCIATYRLLHRPSVEDWLFEVENNVRLGRPAWAGLGKSKTAIVLACLSIATAHREQSKGISSSEKEALALARSDHLFSACTRLTETENGLPSLYSAQARIIQTLYLLTTSRMNRAWYTFGNALQLISALGLHRKTTRPRHNGPNQVDYLQTQLQIRTFWTAYILDKYLGVIFGRPRHYHDDDIDQDLPDSLEDAQITPQGPLSTGQEELGCHIDGLIFHAKLGRIIGRISREVYSIRPISESERFAAAHRLSKEIEAWRLALPAYLVSIHPSMLVTSFRRQCVVLKLGHSHAVMHANRLFLLSAVRSESKPQIEECLRAAHVVLEIVDGLAYEGPLFHAFWWTQYVTFCALVVSYIWHIQLRRRGVVLDQEEEARHLGLMELARRCQTHLAEATERNSPSRRYAVILEEFCSEAIGQKRVEAMSFTDTIHRQTAPNQAQPKPMQFDPAYHASIEGFMEGQDLRYSLLDEWHTTDWLDLDSSAFGPYMDTDASVWMPDMDISGTTI